MKWSSTLITSGIPTYHSLCLWKLPLTTIAKWWSGRGTFVYIFETNLLHCARCKQTVERFFSANEGFKIKQFWEKCHSINNPSSFVCLDVVTSFSQEQHKLNKAALQIFHTSVVRIFENLAILFGLCQIGGYIEISKIIFC